MKKSVFSVLLVLACIGIVAALKRPTTTASLVLPMRFALRPISVAMRRRSVYDGANEDVNGDGQIDMRDLELVRDAYR